MMRSAPSTASSRTSPATAWNLACTDLDSHVQLAFDLVRFAPDVLFAL